MHRLLSNRLALALATFLLLALPATVLAQDFVPDYDDADYPISVAVGEEFVITMESNPTTGYRWELTQQVDQAIVELVDVDFQRRPDGRIGEGGFDQFTFRAVGEGTAEIAFQYVRPWENDIAPARVATFTVDVASPGAYQPATPELPADQAPQPEQPAEPPAE